MTIRRCRRKVATHLQATNLQLKQLGLVRGGVRIEQIVVHPAARQELSAAPWKLGFRQKGGPLAAVRALEGNFSFPIF
jgi:hypothetical protein